MPSVRRSAIAVIAAMCLCAGAAAELDRVFMLHRHGARTQMGVVGETLDCDLPYCTLSKQGIAQCTALGQAFRARYASVLQLPDYDVTKMHSVSTSVPRVIESAESMLTGMYPTALPFVDYVPNTEDLQMSPWTSWPAWYVSGGSYRNETQLSTAILSVFNFSMIQKLGAHFNAPKSVCGTPEIAGRCLSFISDTYFCQLMEGTPMPDWVRATHAEMLRCRAFVLSYVNGYFPDVDPERRAVGSYGYPLASAMIQALSYQAPPGEFDFKFIHRAAHDWTLLGLYTATGTWTPATMADDAFAIDFAEAVVVERHRTASGHNLKAFRMRPGQMHSPTYAFPVTTVEIGFRCLDSNGAWSWTNASADGCPIDDVWRAINTTAPQSAEAECFVTPEQLAANDCTTHDAPAPGSKCEFFRANCPSQPCAGEPGLLADPASGFACRPTTAPAHHGIDAKTLGVTGGITAAAGAVVGAVVMLLSRRRLALAASLSH